MNQSHYGLYELAETLLIPLCYRAIEAQQTHPLICDSRAQDIIDHLGVNPAHLKWRSAQQVFAMLRARQFDAWTRSYLASHSQTVVVEIGCGLDARYERVDDGRVMWVDLDLPEVIALRRRFFVDTSRRQMLANSVFSLDWMERIPAAGSYLFLAEGVFPYFEEREVRRVITTLAERFPGSEMVVDALSPFMVRASAIVPTFRGYRVRPRWCVAHPRKLESWGGGIRLLDCYGYFDQPNPRLASSHWMARVPVLRDSARVLRLGLGDPEQR